MKNLSVAQAQIIEIIKAVSCNAKLILMDEPTSALTKNEVEFLFKKIFEVQSFIFKNLWWAYVCSKWD